MQYQSRKKKYKSKRGFLLGIVLIVSLLLAVFIFSFNSIVRQRNIQAHHLMISETANNLAMSGLRLLSKELGDSYETTIKTSCPDLFTKTAEELGASINLSSSHPVCEKVRSDFQNFLNTLDELREPTLAGGYPACDSMEITLENISRLSPDTTDEQFQAGRDPVEKCGELVLRCVIEYRGLRRQATMTKQFRVVSMVPGPLCRFSLFVKKTPYPDSYNSMGIKFDGSVDNTYAHPPSGNKKYTAPLTIFNGTDSAVITSTIPERTDIHDKNHLRNRGWIFLGPSGAAADEAVFIKIPSGFHPQTGGHFMLGWPSVSAMPVLAPEVIDDSVNFAPDSEFSGHNYSIGAKYQGFYTWEEGNPYGAGGANIWPGLAAGATFVAADHLRSASTWLYPFGNESNESRTLVFGPALAGFLKFYFFRGKNTPSNTEYRGAWAGMSQSMFDSRIAAAHDVPSFASIWDGALDTPIPGSAFFKNGYDSFRKLMPYNSLPDPSPSLPVNGIALNILFDFMKFHRSTYPDLQGAPSIAAASYDSEKFLVPQANEMRISGIKGIHPFNQVSIYFNENGQYDTNTTPDNCYFHGDLSQITVFDSGLVSNRITHILDLKKCTTLAEECQAVERFLFRKVGVGASAVNETKKAGIILIRRRTGISDSYTDALRISSRAIKLVKPQSLLIDRGSLVLRHDITSNIQDGAPSTLFSIALIEGNFFVEGSGAVRNLHAYLVALSHDGGRLLRPPTAAAASPQTFKIQGGLALTEIGLYDDPMNDSKSHLGTTMLHFLNGGEIHYNPRFNPSSGAYSDSRVFVLEDTAGQFSLEGAR